MNIHDFRSGKRPKRVGGTPEQHNMQSLLPGLALLEPEQQSTLTTNARSLSLQGTAHSEPQSHESRTNPEPAGDVAAENAELAPVPQTVIALAISDRQNISRPKTFGELSFRAPERRLVRIGLIDFHPLLQGLYSQWGAQFPPDVTLGYLTPKGIQTIARFLPIHLVASGTRMQCFAGVRLWLAAQNTLGPEAEIEALVYSHIDENGVAEAIEVELDILPVWQRQPEKARKALDIRYTDSSSPNLLRTKFDGTEQEKWQKILRISLKTLQNRVASRRRKA